MRRDQEESASGQAGRASPKANPADSSGRRWLRLWLVVAVLWAGAMTYGCLQGWPTLPLDLPRTDPQIQAAYHRAVTAHVGRYVLLGLAAPLLVLGLGWLTFRFGRRRN